MKLELTEQELQNLLAVLNEGVGVLKLQAVLPLAPILMKLDVANQKTGKPADDGK